MSEIPTPAFGANIWARRMRLGNERYFTRPEDLAEAAAQYFEWIEENPLQDEQAFSYQGNITVHEGNKMRAATWEGLASFLGIHSQTLRNYREREEFAPIIQALEDVLFARDYEGAAAGLLNSALVSRKLGLAEKNELSGPNGGPLEHAVVQYQLPANGRDTPDE